MMSPLVVAFGGGVNSAAALVGYAERGTRPDLILFADPGGERPETYEFVDIMRRWTLKEWDLGIVAVSAAGKYESLEDRCLKSGTLPSIAYGFRSCSHRWKHEPQEKYVNNWQPGRDAWISGLKVRKAIGYDAGESHRAFGITGDKKYEYVYPLIEWRWRRGECIAAIRRAGLPVPVKSACFFCPSSKPAEIVTLKRMHPNLFDRAVAIERAAAAYNTEVKGLGRHWSWEDVGKASENQLDMFQEFVDIPCMCFDGEGSDA